MSDVARLAAQLVAIESINPDVVAGGSGEFGVARFVAEWCERAGLETELTELAPGRANVVAVARGTGGGRSLMLNAHMERSAWPAWTIRSCRGSRTAGSTGAAPTT